MVNALHVTIDSDLRPNRCRWSFDAVAVAILVAASFAPRAGWLGWPAFNPDEAVFAARASYWTATGTSAFTSPLGVEYASEVYRLVALACGPYSMFEIRTLVAAISALMAIGIYVLVGRVTSPWCGLLSGVVFSFYNLWFEGISANREWFSVPWSLLGVLIYLAVLRHNGRSANLLAAGAGLVSGVGFCFKEQGALLAGAVPLAMLCEMWLGGEVRRWLRLLASYVAGALLAVLFYPLPFWVAGTWSQHLHFMIEWRGQFMRANVEPALEMPLWQLYWHVFYQDLPIRVVPLLAYAFALCSIVSVLRAGLRRDTVRGLVNGPLAIVFGAYLLTALATVQLGNRYFAHYYLFLVPPVAVLFGLATYALLGAYRGGPLRWPFLAAICVLLAADLVFVPQAEPIEALEAVTRADVVEDDTSHLGPLPSFQTMAVLGAAAFLVLWAIIIAIRNVPPLRQAVGIVLCGTASLVLAVNLGWMIAKPLLFPAAVFRATPGEDYPALIGYLHEHGRAEDRIYVWGALPEIYTLARMEAASQITYPALVLMDLNRLEKGPPVIDELYADVLMADLRSRRPRFIIHVRDEGMHPELYRLENFPPIVELLAHDYDLVASRSGCDVYVRKDDPVTASAVRRPLGTSMPLGPGDSYRSEALSTGRLKERELPASMSALVPVASSGV